VRAAINEVGVIMNAAEKTSQKSRWRRRTIVVVMIVFAALAVVLIANRAFRSDAASKTAPSRWLTQRIDQGNIARVVSASGAVNPVNQVQVGTQISGTVKRIHVDFNSKVERNQVLAEIDTTTIDAELASAEAAVAVAQANLAVAKQKLDRNQTLFEKGFISGAALDELRGAHAAAEASTRQQRAIASRIGTNRANATIRSPVSGIVVSRDVAVGQTVQASFATPTLFKIAQDLREMQIDANVTEADVGLMKEAQSVSFTVDAFPDRVFSGIVHQIRNNYNVQQNVVTYTVVIRFQNESLSLRPGMTGYVNVRVANRDAVSRLPNTALRFVPASDVLSGQAAPKPNATQRVVWRAGVDGRLMPIVVDIGLADNQFTELVGDTLKVGDEIVIGERVQARSVGPKIF
jgi:HlyD family secretion protein